jgi:MFS family permease
MPAVTGGEHSALGGIYGALFFGAQVAVFALLARTSRWHFRAAPLVAGSLAAVGGAVLCGLCQSVPVFAAGCLLGGLGCGVAYFSSIYYSIAAATGKGHRGGIHEAALGAGGGVIPFLGGTLANTAWAGTAFSWKAGVPFLAAAGFLGLAALIALAIYIVKLRRAVRAAV